MITDEEVGCAELRSRVEKCQSIEALANDQVVYRILDGIVDAYLPAQDRFSEEIDRIEEQVLSDPRPELLATIFQLKRDQIAFRRVLTQTRDLAGHLMRTEHSLISSKLLPNFPTIYRGIVRRWAFQLRFREVLAEGKPGGGFLRSSGLNCGVQYGRGYERRPEDRDWEVEPGHVRDAVLCGGDGKGGGVKHERPPLREASRVGCGWWDAIRTLNAGPW